MAAQLLMLGFNFFQNEIVRQFCAYFLIFSCLMFAFFYSGYRDAAPPFMVPKSVWLKFLNFLCCEQSHQIAVLTHGTQVSYTCTIDYVLL